MLFRPLESSVYIQTCGLLQYFSEYPPSLFQKTQATNPCGGSLCLPKHRLVHTMAGVSALLSPVDISLNIPPLVKKAAKQDNVFSLSVCLKHESVAAWLVSLLIYLPLMILNIHLFIQKAE